MKVFPDHLTVRQALPEFFQQYELGDGGYDQRWFHIKVGPVSIPLPNIAARVRAAKIHDIHHLLTGYPANLRGEAEIGGWEIAAGCGRFWAAWLLNLASFTYGMVFFPRPLFRAFLRGRKARTSLYYAPETPSALSDTRLGELRQRVGTEPTAASKPLDVLLFALWAGGISAAGVAVFWVVFFTAF